MNNLIFKEETHEYFLGVKKLISVTQLMKKHGLSPNYDFVKQEVLDAKAERGKLIHKEIENYIKSGEVGFTKELVQFIKCIATTKTKVLHSETKVHNGLVAGTIDLLLFNLINIIADIKTTYQLNQDAISWQLSIYSYLAKENGLCEKYITTGKVFHFDKDGELNVVDIPIKPYEEVEKLMQCEREGIIYKQELTVVNNELQQLADLETTIAYYDNLKKEADAKAKELREAIKKAMEANAIKTFENDKIRLTYTAPYTKEILDAKKLKEDMPELVKKYTKISNVKASLTITLKENKANE